MHDVLISMVVEILGFYIYYKRLLYLVTASPKAYLGVFSIVFAWQVETLAFWNFDCIGYVIFSKLIINDGRF